MIAPLMLIALLGAAFAVAIIERRRARRAFMRGLIERLTGGFADMQRQVGEILLPAMRSAADTTAKFTESLMTKGSMKWK
jgi:hypothetical protein